MNDEKTNYILEREFNKYCLDSLKPIPGEQIIKTNSRGMITECKNYKLRSRKYYCKFWDNMDGERLFNYSWKIYRGYLNGSIDEPENDLDVMQWLNSIAAERVNNFNSSFYIWGI